VAAVTAMQRWRMFQFDLTTGKRGDARLAEDDIVPHGIAPTLEGRSLATAIVS
jgi:hypothetical protein